MMRLAQAVLPKQVERGYGRIAQISSGAAARGLSIGVAAYGAANAGAEGLIRHLAVECGSDGATPNALSLGMMEGLPRADDPALQRVIRHLPIGRLGTPAGGRSRGVAVQRVRGTRQRPGHPRASN